MEDLKFGSGAKHVVQPVTQTEQTPEEIERYLTEKYGDKLVPAGAGKRQVTGQWERRVRSDNEKKKIKHTYLSLMASGLTRPQVLDQIHKGMKVTPAEMSEVHIKEWGFRDRRVEQAAVEAYKEENGMANHVLEHPMKEEYLELRAQGVSKTQIRKRFNISQPTLADRLKKWGIARIEDEEIALRHYLAATSTLAESSAFLPIDTKGATLHETTPTNSPTETVETDEDNGASTPAEADSTDQGNTNIPEEGENASEAEIEANPDVSATTLPVLPDWRPTNDTLPCQTCQHQKGSPSYYAMRCGSCLDCAAANGTYPDYKTITVLRAPEPTPEQLEAFRNAVQSAEDERDHSGFVRALEDLRQTLTDASETLGLEAAIAEAPQEHYITVRIPVTRPPFHTCTLSQRDWAEGQIIERRSHALRGVYELQTAVHRIYEDYKDLNGEAVALEMTERYIEQVMKEK